MPRTSVLLLGLIAASVCIPGPRTTIPRPVFYARALATPAERVAILGTDRILDNSALDTALANNYNGIDPEKSLFVDDCATWCADPAFSFATQFGVAANLAAPGNPSGVLSWWKTSAAAAIFDFTPDIADSLQLAGVVNRIDYATPTGPNGNWENAELRFVYAPPDDIVSFRLILEFVLHPMPDAVLRQLAQDWYDLSKLSGDPYLAKLKGIVAASSIDLVRLRTNANLVNHPGAPWSFAQWEFAPGSYKQTMLTDQIYQNCTKWPSVSQAPGTCQHYKDVWSGLLAQPQLPLYWHILYPELMPQTIDYDNGDSLNGKMSGMPIPNDLGVTPTCEARDLLAVQQCSWCHGAETKTVFTHVGNKLSATKRDLSLFLRGNKTKPSYVDYNNPNSGVFNKVDLIFETPLGINCKEPVTSGGQNGGLHFMCETRSYHDLGRRMMSLASILVSQPQNTKMMDPTTFRDLRAALIDSYAPHMVH
jgi:hypothetical protein